MNITLTIQANSLGELAHIFAATPGPQQDPARSPRLEVAPGFLTGVKEVEPGDGEMLDELPVEEKPAKKSRAKRGGTAKQDTPESTAGPSDGAGPTATTDASPSDEPVKFEDVRAFASGLMDSGKADGRAIQAMLKEKFGVSAFGPLKEEQYPAVMAELENLAA